MNAIVKTRNFFANPRKNNGVSFIEFINGIRTEIEAYVEMGELEMAQSQCYGLIKVERAKGYTTGVKLMEKIVSLMEERKIARRQEIKAEQAERRDNNIRIKRMVSMMERIAQEEQSKAHVKLARQQRELHVAELKAKRELARKAKEDRNVWLAHHEELDNTLTHNPFAALQGIKVAVKEQPEIEQIEEQKIEACEPVTEVEFQTLLATYTAAIDACKEMGQWEEVQELLGDEFFNQNITEELVEELCNTAELVADCQ